MVAYPPMRHCGGKHQSNHASPRASPSSCIVHVEIAPAVIRLIASRQILSCTAHASSIRTWKTSSSIQNATITADVHQIS